jgi:hypothetical protein
MNAEGIQCGKWILITTKGIILFHLRFDGDDTALRPTLEPNPTIISF